MSFCDGAPALTHAEIGKVGALVLSPWSDTRAKLINDTKINAVSKGLSQHSVAYLTGKHRRAEKRDVASGTLIAIGHRVFVVTAGHTIAEQPTRVITLVGARHRKEAFESEIIRSGKRPDNRPDVGYVEVPTDLPRTLDREPIDLSRVSKRRSGTPGQVAFLFGYPAVWASPDFDHRRRVATVPLRSMTYPNVLLARDEWPSLDADASRASRLCDLFMAYSIEEELKLTQDERRPQLPETVADRVPSPVGASGGGIWQNTPRRRGVWYADLTLIGIQSAWSKPNRYIRGVQVFHWLKLIHDDYPDLRALMCDFGLGEPTRRHSARRRPR